MNKDALRAVLKSIIWDYDVNSDELFEVITGRREKAGPFDAERLLVRMVERLSWYELIDLLGIKYIKDNLNESAIKKIRFNLLRERYETIRQILSGATLSFSGWNPEYREKIKHTLLSNRRYRTQ
jgi:hypothetical protein